MAHPDAHRFLPLKPDALLVLMALQRESRHGYGIIRDVEARSGGETVLQTGALYRLLKRLLADGLIEEVDDPAACDDRRRFYLISPMGSAVLAAELERMENLIREARRDHGRGHSPERPRLA